MFKSIKAKKAEPFMNPYKAGIGLGLVLLLAFVIMGRGLGASGAFTSLVTAGVNSVNHEHAQNNGMYSSYIGDGTVSIFKDWLVFEVLGVFVGGFISGFFSRRIKKDIEHGPRFTNKKRLFFAFAGGMIMGIGAKFARGCTSGQALTGGALLNVGSWIFMLAIFASAYSFAYFFKRQWI